MFLEYLLLFNLFFMKNFLYRTVFGALYVAVVVLSIVYYRSLPWLFGIAFGVVSMLAAREYHVVVGSSKFLVWSNALLAALLFVGYFLMSAGIVSVSEQTVVGVYGLCLIVVLVSELFRREQPIANWGNTLVSQVMVVLPFVLMNRLIAVNPHLLLALFVVIWVNDSGAYCVGSLLGKHKMFVRVSPGKTWEGLAGGVLFSVIAGAIFYYAVGTYSLAQWLVLSAVISGVGTLGDLMESLLKRTVGIKDSGRFLPGHGGVLDRFDSILLATPVVYILMTFIL